MLICTISVLHINLYKYSSWVFNANSLRYETSIIAKGEDADLDKETFKNIKNEMNFKQNLFLELIKILDKIWMLDHIRRNLG